MSSNSSNVSAAASWRGPEPSRRLLRYGVAIHLGVAVCCLVSVRTWPLAAALLALLAASAVRCVRIWRDLPDRIRSLPDGRWRLERAGRASDCRLLAPVFVSTGLVILRLRAGRRIRTLALAADSLPPDSFRRLRARLLQYADGRRNRT